MIWQFSFENYLKNKNSKVFTCLEIIAQNDQLCSPTSPVAFPSTSVVLYNLKLIKVVFKPM